MPELKQLYSCYIFIQDETLNLNQQTTDPFMSYVQIMLHFALHFLTLHFSHVSFTAQDMADKKMIGC